MSTKFSIKDKKLNLKEQSIVEKYCEVFIEYGDWIFIEEIKRNVEFEILDDDLKLLINDREVLILKEFTRLLKENPNENFPAQFSDLNLINQLTTKLEFVKSDLFDESFLLKDIEALQQLLNQKPIEKKSETILHKSVKFQYEQQDTLEVEDEVFELYKQEDLEIYIRT